MKKYKTIGIIMVMVGKGNLLSVLLDEQAYNTHPEPQLYFGSAIVILLGFYILHLANKQSIV
jgi:hypothetical protein